MRGINAGKIQKNSRIIARVDTYFITYRFMFKFQKRLENTNLEDLTARELYEKCRNIGSLALKSRRQFIGLLPLVERRQAYLGRGLYSTYDFAAKLGGISRDIVTEVLRLDRQLHDYPLVRRVLYKGNIGWSKIRMVTAWLTIENQKEWIEKLENISNQALTLYLRDFTAQQYRELQGSITDFKSESIQYSQPFGQLTQQISILQSSIIEKSGKNEAESFGAEISEYNRKSGSCQISGQMLVRGNMNPQNYSSLSKFDQLAYERETFTFSLNRQIAAKMRLFRQKLEKDRKELITWEEVMVEFLNHIEQKEEVDTQKPIMQKEQTKEEMPASRHIPAGIRRAVLKQYDGLCAFNNCNAPAEIFHHTRRFSLTSHLPGTQAHDPNFIKPLCKPHERVIHNALIENENINPAQWKLLSLPDRQSEKYAVDQMVIGYRKPK